jgi:histone-lysine N-methyltransferase SETD3
MAPPQAIERLFEWLGAGGASLSALELRAYDGMERGAHTRSGVRSGDTVLEVPESHLITLELARASEIGCRIEASGLRPERTHSWLAAFLLQERHREGSFWEPYLDTLPAAFPHVPIFFQPEQLAWLRGSHALELVQRRREALVQEYRRLSAIPELRRFPLSEFVWASTCVVTRVFGISVDGVKTSALVPMADMLNHRLPRQTRWLFDASLRSFVITAAEDIGTGEPVQDSYGAKSNGRYLLSYGFCVPDNPEDTALLRLPALDAPRSFVVTADLKTERARDMLTWLYQTHGTGQGLRVLAAACREALARFETGLQEDLALLAEDRWPRRLPRNLRNAVLVRSGEKRVLCRYLAFAEAGGIPEVGLPCQ